MEGAARGSAAVAPAASYPPELKPFFADLMCSLAQLLHALERARRQLGVIAREADWISVVDAEKLSHLVQEI